MARRLFRDLVCLCGRCARLTLEACGCEDAAVERKNILKLLESQDLSSVDGEQLAYKAVVDTYVARFGGRHVLASESTSASDGGWAVLVGALLAAVALFFAIEWNRRRTGSGISPARAGKPREKRR